MVAPASAVMIQGTASSVGKSILTTALCRLFKNAGLSVLPFKSQNMALNAFVTPDGLEIGRAQAVQAAASGAPAHVDMNPILLKPEGDCKSQVVVMGRSIGRMSAVDYHAYKPELKAIVKGCIDRLRARCDVLVIEGAGSPAEINLKPRDIVNMHVAHAADARVLLVGDIDRGGVFAALVGTMLLLEPEDRARVSGFLINKFRGDASLLTSGLEFLEAHTGVPTLGVVPHIERLRIADEDSVALDRKDRRRAPREHEVAIAIVRLPRLSNYDDFAPLEHEPGVLVRYVDEPKDLDGADLVIVPGSKSTVTDLAWLRQGGLAGALLRRAAAGQPIVGVCGGCQMLGESIDDPDHVESSQATVPGLGLLPIRTVFGRDKRTAQVRARATRTSLLAPAGATFDGYEIHAGRIRRDRREPALFVIGERNKQPDDDADGATNDAGNVLGTMIHGLFDGDVLRAHLVDELRRNKGLPPAVSDVRPAGQDDEYDRLASVVGQHIDQNALFALVGRPHAGGPA